MNEARKLPFINPADLTTFSLRAAAIIKIDEKFVLVRNEGQDKYKLPGGHLNSNESFADGIKRELKEELDLNISVSDSPDFYDQLVINDLIIVTGYFIVKDFNFSVEELTNKSKLSLSLFSIEELSEINIYPSEIAAVTERF